MYLKYFRIVCARDGTLDIDPTLNEEGRSSQWVIMLSKIISSMFKSLNFYNYVMKNAKKKPMFYRLKINNLGSNIKNEVKTHNNFDNKKDIIIGEKDILIKINAINDSNFESFFDTLEKQKNIWNICKINGQTYFKIEL